MSNFIRIKTIFRDLDSTGLVEICWDFNKYHTPEKNYVLSKLLSVSKEELVYLFAEIEDLYLIVKDRRWPHVDYSSYNAMYELSILNMKERLGLPASYENLGNHTLHDDLATDSFYIVEVPF